MTEPFGPRAPAANPDAVTEAALLDLLREVGGDRKAELVDGEVHVLSPTDDVAGRCAENVYLSLRAYEATAGGRARGDNHTYLVNIPGRRSFSPDASYAQGKPAGRRAVTGAPDFAVEVRSAGDYGPRAEERTARKRADYFLAGTRVVWDVDPDGFDAVRVYRAARPDPPDVYRRGDVAEAEPAVPGWRFAGDELFI